MVNVAGKIRGPLQQALNLNRQSPLTEISEQALEKASATGQADIDLRLSLPTENMDAAKVQGTVLLKGNDIRITPTSPLLTRSQGTVSFDENGFTLKGARTHLLGGAATLEGGTLAARPAAKGAQQQVKRFLSKYKGSLAAKGYATIRPLAVLQH